MTPKYEKAVDLLLQDLLKIIESASLESESELGKLAETIRLSIDAASSQLTDSREWKKYGRFAVVAWMDQEISDIHPSWMRNNSLETHYFKSQSAERDFFRRAQHCYNRDYKDAYELFFICFMMGFRGVYESTQRGRIPNELPATEIDWHKQASRRVRRLKKIADSPWRSVRQCQQTFLSMESRNSLFNQSLLLIFAVCFLVFFWFRI